jgi:PAS domain S-box-containing protein
MLAEADIAAETCASATALLDELNRGAAFVIVTEEALTAADLTPLDTWLRGQEEWSDLPFVLLTHHGGGLERNPTARRFLDVLGNVTFLERPFHPTTLVSLARSALRGRQRQYEARARLAALREGEARFRNMADHAPVMMWVTEADGSCSYLNRGWYDFTGQSEAEALGFGWLDATHPDDRARAERVFLEANAEQSPSRVEYRLRRKDGAYRWTIDAAAPRFGPDGAFLGYIGSVIDIDERREIEDRLRENEERLRLATENAEIGFWDVDLVQDVLIWPSRVKAMFGISPDVPVTMRDFYDGLHPEDAAATAEAFALAADPVRRGLYDVEYRTIGKEDGRVRWVAAKGRGLFDETGRCVRVIGTAIDVTARKVTEMALRELNNTLEQKVSERTAERNRVWSTSRDLLAVMGFDGYLKAINPAWEATLGIDEATLLSRPFPQQVHPDDHEAVEATVARLRRGEAVIGFEDRLQHANGSWRRIAWSLVPEGDVFYAVGRDITAEKAAAEELERAHDALRQAQKMEAVGQLTGGVAHDFNNLLTIIKSSTDLLRRPDLPEERRHRYVDSISDTVDRASKLTGQLLSFARRQALKPEVFDTASRLRATADMVRTVVGSRVEIVTEITSEACFVKADASQFETALVNMVVNARDAMDGEGRLTIRVEAVDAMPAIRGHTGGVGPFVAVSVSDTGIGIPAEKIAQIFEPFFTTKEVGKGTGLGLSQVYGFAKQSGGDVDVWSVVGQGTKFTLYLPRADEAQAAEAVTDNSGSRAIAEGHGRRVLVVEDNVEVGRFSTQLLEDLGYQTTWAANADEALTLLAEVNGFEAVFSDVVMPGMSGIDLGQEIRRRYPGLPVVLTSGYSSVLAEEGRHGFELLQKPYAAEELSRILRRVTKG